MHIHTHALSILTIHTLQASGLVLLHFLAKCSVLYWACLTFSSRDEGNPIRAVNSSSRFIWYIAPHRNEQYIDNLLERYWCTYALSMPQRDMGNVFRCACIRLLLPSAIWFWFFAFYWDTQMISPMPKLALALAALQSRKISLSLVGNMDNCEKSGKPHAFYIFPIPLAQEVCYRSNYI